MKFRNLSRRASVEPTPQLSSRPVALAKPHYHHTISSHTSSISDFRIREILDGGTARTGCLARSGFTLGKRHLQTAKWGRFSCQYQYGTFFVQKDEEQNALMSLFHTVTNNLPSTTRAPELDNRNAATVLRADADQ
ncbi:hypothetical protein F4779DRAFT_297201 [Xylariaceae sp. FL0662B]|nr:hypothetical protein F4779DRAFT_297201 [Xylariaceae sp. FL0662B]